jgi:hypothetical protein
MFVVAVFREQGTDDGNLIGMTGDVRQRLRKLQAGLTVLVELVRALEQVAGDLLVIGHFLRRRLAVVFLQQRLGIEQVDVARPAVHEQLNHRPGLRGEVRWFRLHIEGGRSGRIRAKRFVIPEESRQSQAAKAAAKASQHATARRQLIVRCHDQRSRSRNHAQLAWGTKR